MYDNGTWYLIMFTSMFLTVVGRRPQAWSIETTALVGSHIKSIDKSRSAFLTTLKQAHGVSGHVILGLRTLVEVHRKKFENGESSEERCGRA